MAQILAARAALKIAIAFFLHEAVIAGAAPTPVLLSNAANPGTITTDGTNLYVGNNNSILDTLENQLISNTPGAGIFFGFTGNQGYPFRRELHFNPKFGWHGPYLANPPPTDPWGNKYYINIKFLHPDELDNRRSVFVLSAGPNETIQTPFTIIPSHPTEKLKPFGDDVAERLR